MRYPVGFVVVTSSGRPSSIWALNRLKLDGTGHVVGHICRCASLFMRAWVVTFAPELELGVIPP